METMNTGSVFRDFTKYVSLNVLGMICISCYILVDTIFIAMALGSNGLTALNLSISVFGVLLGVGLMIGIGGATQYSILKSGGGSADSVFTHSLAAGLFAAIILVVIGALFVTPLAKMLGADADTLPLTVAYMQTMLYFAPFFILNNILTAFIRNDNNPKLAMAGMFVGSFSNIVLDYVFLFPLSMGMFGAALATGLSLVLSVCVLSLHFWSSNNQLTLCKCKISVKKLLNIFLLGSSAMVNELSFTITLITFNLVILQIEGNIGVAAFGVVANIAVVAIAIFTGVAQGIQPLISKGHGSGNCVLVRQTLKYAMASVTLLAFIIYGITYFNSAVIVSAFNSEANATLALLATSGIEIYFAGFAFAGMNIIAAAFLSASDSAKAALIISVLRGCVIIVPMVIISSAILGMDGVWLSFVFTELIVSVLSVVFFVRKLK